MDIKTITLNDPDYSRLLRDIFSPPQKLFYQGALQADPHPLAVVGTRRLSAYGAEVTGKIVRPLARAGICIVSGLALGIDACAHQAALDAGGRTIAVLGSGLDRPSFYPSANWRLTQDIIASGGLIMSEYPPGTPALAAYFPQRNRIVAGISRGVLVIEAPPKSGALITARLALEEGREIFAVPGPITSPNSYGPNWLIKKGAIPVTEAADILELWDLEEKTKEIKTITADTVEEAGILKLLQTAALPLDEITRQTGLSVATAAACLTLMEMRGLIKNINGKYQIN